MLKFIPLLSSGHIIITVMTRKDWIALVVGFFLFIVLVLFPAPSGMEQKGWYMFAVVALVAVWWITEPIPLCVTALLPIVLLPVLGIVDAEKVTLSYANEVIYLFLGGFMFALAMERSKLHYRFALHTIRLIGGSPRRLVLGFMIATYVLSMWVSNTATVLMMIPITIALTNQIVSGGLQEREGDKQARNFSKALYLSIAYSASIGGIATLIGTPPNIVLASMVKQTEGVDITFAQWMLFALPFTLVLLFITWVLLTRVIFPIGNYHIPVDRTVVKKEISTLGGMTMYEKRVLLLFSCVAFLWIFRGVIDIPFFTKKITDTTIAIAGAFLLFVLPSGQGESDRLLNWDSAKKLPWNILLLFGGGLALSSGFSASGLSGFIVEQIDTLGKINLWALIAIVAGVTLFLTEIMSNTATATLFIPIMLTIGSAMNIHPLMLAIPVTIAASGAFMLPAATPPNAIVFSYGYISIREMTTAGVLLNSITLVLITLFSMLLIPCLF